MAAFAQSACQDVSSWSSWRTTTTFSNCSSETYGSGRAAGAGARAFLETHGAELGIDSSQLEQFQVKHGLASSHVRYQQTFDGIKVFGGNVSVHLDGTGAVQTVHRSFFPTSAVRNPSETVSSDQAVAAAQRSAVRLASGETDRAQTGRAASDRHPVRPSLVWYPVTPSELALAWELTLFSNQPLGDFLTVVDAASGKVLFQENRIAFSTRGTATGTGDVFIPNPYQTQGSGVNMNDNGDASSAALVAQLISVTLNRLDLGTGLLKGTWVDMTALAGLPVADANEMSRVYQYTRDDDRFEQVVIYHSLDSIQAYFHDLGFDDDVGTPNGIRDFPTVADAHWYTLDQSFYSTGDDGLHFGDGGVDDGEDADIIAHEYGHAVQHNQNANWGGGEMGAMGEAFGDYLAMSFYFADGDAAFQAANAPCVGEWDATSYSGSNPPCLRRTDGNKMYPDDLVGQVHADGEIWSRALSDLRAATNGFTTDQLVLEHHFALPAGATMPVAAMAMVTADSNLNSGSNEGAIRTAFCDRGILSGADCIISNGSIFEDGFEGGDVSAWSSSSP